LILPSLDNPNDLDSYQVNLLKSPTSFINSLSNFVIFRMIKKKIPNFNFYLRILTNEESYYIVQKYDTNPKYYYPFK
jgi:hypothetical protein